VFLIIIVSNLLFALGDLVVQPPLLIALLELKVVQMTGATILWQWLGRRRNETRLRAATLAAVVLASSLTALSGVLTGETMPTLMLLSLAGLTLPVLVPWGWRDQSIAVGILAICAAGNIWAVDPPHPSISYPAVGFVAGLGLSLYLAADLERRRRAMELSREDAERSRGLLETMTEHVMGYLFIVGNDGRIRYVSPSIRQVLGLDPEQILGTDAFSHVHPDDLLQLAADLQETSLGQAVLPAMTYRTKHADGSWRYVEVRINNLFDDPVIAGLLGSAHDITEHKLTEDRVHESQQFLQAALDSLSAHIAIIEENGTIIATNRTWRTFAELNGALAAADPGSNYLDVCDRVDGFGAADARVVARGIRRVLAGSTPSFEHEYPCDAPGDAAGEARWFAVQVTPLHGTRGAHAVIAHENITRRKQAEAEIAAARDQAIDVARRRSEFLTVMSHEVRTPLNGVLGMTELLLDTTLDPQQRTFAQHVRSAGESMLSIVNDILDFSKVEAGKLVIERIDFTLRSIADAAMSSVTEAAWRKGLHLETRIDPDVPERLHGDPNRLRQVLANLLGNAVKFTETGSVTLLIKKVTELPGLVTLRFEVIDTGIGIDPTDSDHLFEPFVQGTTSTARRFGGSGLGLAISKHLVGLLGGNIGVQSRPAGGSTFWFTARFAGAAASVETPAPRPIADEPTRSILPQQGRRHPAARILVVEDNPINKNVAVRLLAKLGYRSEAVDSGAEAIERVANERFDAILMDCQMPSMDGFEATRRIRALANGTVPIIAVTAYAIRGDRERCLAAGMDDYLAKPVSSESLSQVLQRWLPASSTATPSSQGRTNHDTDRLADLLRRFDGDRSLVSELAAIFIESAPSLLSTIHEAMAEGDTRTLGRTAHTLKGAVSNFDDRDATSAALTLETLASGGADRATLQAALESVDQTVANLQRLLEQFVDAQASDRA